MDTDIKYAPFYASLYTMAGRLGDNARLALFDAFRGFCFTGEYPDFLSPDKYPRLTDAERNLLDLSFMQIAPTLEATLRKIAGGKKGGRKRERQ